MLYQVISDGQITSSYVSEIIVEPPGTIKAYGGSTPPSGYLMCNGDAVSRLEFHNLFDVIGTSFGIGDGSTTFNLPDMQGNAPVGIGGSGVTNIGDTGGEQTHTLNESEMPSHTHVSDSNSFFSSSDGGGLTGNNGTTNNGQTSEPTGGDGAHNNMTPYIGTEWIIKS